MIDTGDTAWVLISAALVFIMTPGLAFFYGGMVRSKNVLTTIMQSFFIVAMISVEWVLIGYTMTFGADINGFIGSLDKLGLAGECSRKRHDPRTRLCGFPVHVCRHYPSTHHWCLCRAHEIRCFCRLYPSLGYLDLQSDGTLGMGRRLPG